MKPIQMVDLHTQYLEIKDEVDQAIQSVIDNTAFIKGPAVTEFAGNLSDYLGAKHVIPCGNGTDALQIALMALDLKPGDEVITPAFTFIATVEVIALLGLKPVFVDIEPGTFNIDTGKIEELINEKTKAIIPVHLFGQACNMDKINNLAKEYHLHVVEDNAQAIGCTFKREDGKTAKTGTLGTIGCTSFFPSKNLGAFGDGGAICTNDDQLGDQLKYLANHGMEKRYHYDHVGVNSRLDTIQAAILNVKLKKLDQYIQNRQRAAKYYDEHLKGIDFITTPARNGYSDHVFHQYTMKINGIDRDALQGYLKENEIPSMIYYPVPLHLQKAYAYLGYKEGNLPVTEECCKKVISLPMHTELDEEQLAYICNKLKNFK